jgi:hypothetical protein
MVDEKHKTSQHEPNEVKAQHEAVAVQSRPAGRAGKAGVDTQVAPPFPATNDIWPRPPLDVTGFGDLSTGAWDFAPGLPGLIADAGIKDVITRIPETAIAFGVFVQEGTTQGFCKAAGAGAGRVLGIALRDMTAGFVDPTTGLLGYTAHRWATGILRVGRVWCVPSTAVTRGEDATYDTADGTPSAGGATPIVGATWYTDAAAGQLAVLQLNLTN